MKYLEVIFEIIYLLFGFIISLYLLIKSKTKDFKLFSIMGLVLVIGDSFHLIPRIFNSLGEFNNINYYLGIGKLITSITMTIFYILLLLFIKIKTKFNNKTIDLVLIILGIIRIILCLLPFNNWTSITPSYLWRIIRNIPFWIMGIIMFIISIKLFKNNNYYRYLGLAILLSFIFYTLTVLFASKFKIFGMMMLPKTICYMWILLMGLIEFKNNKNLN